MANDQDLLVNNTAPGRKDIDRNLTVDVFVAPKTFGVNHTSTAGLRRLGSLDIGSYDLKTTTTTNKTQLGGNKRTVNTHINGTEAQLVGKFNEITPFGLVRKNPAQVSQLFSLSATLYTIVATGLQSLTLATVANLFGQSNGAEGSYLQFNYTLPAANTDERYIESISGSVIQLATPLDESPAVGSVAREIYRYITRVGGNSVRKDTLISRMSGDDGMTMFHEVPEIQYTNGELKPEKDNISMLNLTAEVIGFSADMDGIIQTKLFDEIVYPNTPSFANF